MYELLAVIIKECRFVIPKVFREAVISLPEDQQKSLQQTAKGSDPYWQNQIALAISE